VSAAHLSPLRFVEGTKVMSMRSRTHSALFVGLALLAASSAWALELPPMKQGLWETASTSSLRPDLTARMQLCYGAGTEHELMAKGEAALKQYDCVTPGFQRSGNSYVYESACTIGGHKLTTRSVLTYQGDDVIHGVTTSDSGDGKPAHINTSDSHWVGACRPGQKAGDSEFLNRDEMMRPPARPARDHAAASNPRE
jgi:hypothetical protein